MNLINLFFKDGSIYAYGQSDKGSDWVTIKFRRADGTELPDRIEKVRYSGLEWMKDGSGIFYNSYPQQEGEKIVIEKICKKKTNKFLTFEIK